MVPLSTVRFAPVIYDAVRSSALNHVARIHLSSRPWTGVCASVQAVIPPSTVRFAPVMYEDSGPATNATSAAEANDIYID